MSSYRRKARMLNLMVPSKISNVLLQGVSKYPDIACFQITPSEFFFHSDSTRSAGSFVCKLVNSEEVELGFADIMDFPESGTTIVSSILSNILDNDTPVNSGDKFGFTKYKCNQELLEEVCQSDPDIISDLIEIFESHENIEPNNVLATIKTLKTSYPIDAIIRTFKELSDKELFSIVRDSNPIGYYHDHFDEMTDFMDDFSDGNILPE